MAVILFFPIDIGISILYYNSGLGTDSFKWLFLDYLFLIPLISIGISYIIAFILSFIFGIPRRKKEEQKEKQKQLEFENYAKSYILAQKFLDSHKIDITQDFFESDFHRDIDKIRNELKNNKERYVYDSLTLDEQKDYLEKVPLLIAKVIKNICKKIKNEIENEQNIGFKYYCNDEIIKKHNIELINYLQDIIDFDVTEFEDSNNIQNKFKNFMFKYLNIYGLANDSFVELYDCDLSAPIYNCKDGSKNLELYISVEGVYGMGLTFRNEEEAKEHIKDIKMLLIDPDFTFIRNNIQANFYKRFPTERYYSDGKNEYLGINLCWTHNDIFKEIDAEMFKILYIKNLIITYLYAKKRTLLTDYIRDIWNINDSYNVLFEELDKDRGVIFSGVAGEQAVEDEFKIYKDELEYFSNIRFEEDDLSVETDGLIVSERGIFSIEIKNYKFQKLRISKDGRWTKCIYDDEETIKDVGSQMNRHIIITERLFNNYLKEQGIKEKIEIKPMIIIANNDIEIENESDMLIVRTSQIYNNFKKSNCKYSKKTVTAIKKYIKDNKLPAKKYKITNYEKTFENITKSILDNKDNNVKLFNEILRVINEDLPKELESELDS